MRSESVNWLQEGQGWTNICCWNYTEMRRCLCAEPTEDSARWGKEGEEDPQNAGETEGKDSMAGLSWGGKPSHTLSPGAAIQLMALQALKKYQMLIRPVVFFFFCGRIDYSRKKSVNIALYAHEAVEKKSLPLINEFLNFLSLVTMLCNH